MSVGVAATVPRMLGKHETAGAIPVADFAREATTAWRQFRKLKAVGAIPTTGSCAHVAERLCGGLQIRYKQVRFLPCACPEEGRCVECQENTTARARRSRSRFSQRT